MMTGIRNVNNLVPGYWILTLVFLLFFAIYDYRHHLIRNKALVAFLFWCLLYIPVKASAEIGNHWVDLTFHALLGCMVAFWLFVLIAILSDGGIGGGDVKLVTVLAIPLGTCGILSVILFSCLSALLHIGIKKWLLKSAQGCFPYAPYLLTGTLLYALPQIIR